MTGKEVIKAAQMFTKTGRASQVSALKEIAIGLTLGISLGLVWQNYHWSESKKWEEFYAAQARK